MMKKACVVLSAIFLSVSVMSVAHADSTGSQVSSEAISWKQKVVKSKVTQPTKPIQYLTLETFFTDVCNQVGDGIPSVYRDIHINWPGVKGGSSLYNAIQKCVYLGLLDARGKINNFSYTPNGNFLYDFFAQKFNLALNVTIVLDKPVSLSDWQDLVFDRIPTYARVQRIIQASAWGSNSAYASKILQSPYFNALGITYAVLKESYHYLSGGVNDEALMYGGVKGMLDSLNDQYSTYFPPEKANSFLSDIQGEFEGVGAYVDVIDGKFTFVAVLAGSPAMEAGVQPGDHVLAVDDWQVPAQFTVNEVIGRIKGPAGTKVTVTIERSGTTMKLIMTRKKLTVPLLDIKKKNGDLIFTITSFGKGLDTQFVDALTTHKDDIASAKNIIIDLRNNGGGYVDVVNNMMNYFVASGQVLLQYEFKDHKEIVLSAGPAVSPFANKSLIILINKGSASASEILAGVLKDYYPNAKLVGEKSYGKGSMQSLDRLPNGGSFKYTLALRYIGKSAKSIEKTGLIPDVQIIDDRNTINDEVMDAVLSW